MPKVVVIAQVEDSAKWEEAFQTRGNLFRETLTVTAPVGYAIADGNEIAVYCEPDNLETFTEAMAGPTIAEAMAQDGVKRETVKMYVLDKELAV